MRGEGLDFDRGVAEVTDDEDEVIHNRVLAENAHVMFGQPHAGVALEAWQFGGVASRGGRCGGAGGGRGGRGGTGRQGVHVLHQLSMRPLMPTFAC